MAEEAREEKRPAVKARKAEEQQAQKPAKGARRKQRSGTGPRSADRAYGTRNVRKLHQGPAISITVQLPVGLRRKPASKKAGPAGKAAGPAKAVDRGRQPGTAAAPAARRPLRRVLLRPVVALLVIIVAGAAFYYFPGKTDTKKPTATAAAATRTAPDYQPLVPATEKATETSYDGKRDMVAYNANFSGARLIVSQQSLPESFTKDPSAIMKAADSIKATQQIETAKGLLYVATNEDAGYQLAIIADRSVLIFIQSNQKLNEVTWKAFIDQLQAKTWEKVKP